MPETARQASTPEAAVLKTLLVTDLVDSTKLTEALGDERMAEIFRRHDRIARDLLAVHQGREADRTDGFLLLFDRPINAVAFALAFHRGLTELGREAGALLAARIGIHLGEVVLIETSAADLARGAKPLEVEGLAKPTAARLMSLALGGQTLLSRSAFELARRAAVDAFTGGEALRWEAHGRYRMKGVAEPLEVFEVGIEGESPLAPPPDTEKVHRVSDEATVLGWRPGVGLEVPQRPHWVLAERLGEGGFGEVWLARHAKTHDRRVFKFCFDAKRSGALKREITIFRFLYERLRERDDISRILDWQLDEPPYFLEAEYTAGGSLLVWAAAQGGIAAVPLGTRLEIVAQAAEALAAAHAVGVLHQDVKPANILIAPDHEGRPHAQLADFGIGLITDRDNFVAAGITVAGMTEPLPALGEATQAGTRLYMAPELLEGREPTVQADIYALGVVLYQMVVGDLARAMAPGWERDVGDELLREDIAAAADGSPERRIGNARELALRLRGLEGRRAERGAERARAEAVERDRKALERARQRRKLVIAAMALLAVFGSSMALLARRIYLEKERAKRDRQTAQEVSQFLVSLFEVSDPERESGGKITARELLERGAAKVERELASQPQTQAHLMGVIGTVYRKYGLFSDAEPLLRRSLALREGSEPAPSPILAESLNQLAILATEQGRFTEAEALFQRCLAIREEELAPDSAEIADTLSNLAALRRQQGRPAEAAPLLERALAISEKALGPDHPDLAASLNNLAAANLDLGHLDEVEALLRRTVGIYEKAGGATDPRLATSLANLAEILAHRGRFEEAGELYARALGIAESTLGADSPGTASVLHGQANLFLLEKRYALAEPLYQRVLAIRERALGPDHPDLINSLRDYAELLEAVGRRGEGARLRERAAAIEAGLGRS